MSFPSGYNSANYNNEARWPAGLNEGNVTTVGTNGGPSCYGTEDQSGNVWEWNEQIYDNETGSRKGIMGGAFNTDALSISISGINSSLSTTKSANIGIRLVSQDPNASFATFVGIGNIDNVADNRTSLGDVNYTFNIMSHPVTNQQYVRFLNVVDPSGLNTNNLYYTLSPTKPKCGILLDTNRTIGDKYITKTYFENKPVNYVNWKSCAMLCNWLHNGSGSTSSLFSGVYTITGDVISSRSIDYLYAIPTEDEWYKSAFYNPDSSTYYAYATQSNTIPCAVGSVGCNTSVNITTGDGSDSVVEISPTPTPTNTVTPTISVTPTVTPSTSLTPTPTQTPDLTPTPTPTPTTTVTPTVTPTISITPTITPTITVTLSISQSTTPTPTASITPSITVTRTPTRTPTPTPTVTPTVTPTLTPTPSITPTKSLTPSVDICFNTDGIIHNKYSIIDFPKYAETINLLSSDNEIILSNIDSIFQTNYTDPNAELLFFNVISSGNINRPDNNSTLTELIPGETYYIIAKNNANFPIILPGFPDKTWYSKYAHPSILNKIKSSLGLSESNDSSFLPDDSETKALLSNENISWTKLIQVLYSDMKKYLEINTTVSKKLADILFDFQEYYKEYSIENIGILEGVYQYCNEIYPSGYTWNKFANSSYNNLDPIIIVDPENNGSIKIEVAAEDSDVIPINVLISGLIHYPNSNITYDFNIIDSSENCTIYPRSGTISVSTQNVINLKSIFNFCDNQPCLGNN